MPARILFLKEFTKELILNSNPEIRKRILAQEKLREKSREEDIFEKIKRIKEREGVIEIENIQSKKPEEIKIEEMEKSAFTPEMIKQPLQITFQPEITTAIPVERPAERIETRQLTGKIKRGFISASDFRKEKIERGEPEFDLGRINPIVYNPFALAVECPGPGKFIIVKTAVKTSVTKMMLSKEEIDEVIAKFSEEAKIPLIGGVFKAAVGNLIITALQSELIGSRFIITKISSYQPQFLK